MGGRWSLHTKGLGIIVNLQLCPCLKTFLLISHVSHALFFFFFFFSLLFFYANINF